MLLRQSAFGAALAASAAVLIAAQNAVLQPGAAGYLPPADIQAAVRALPPPPSPNDARDIADRAIFRATRSLAGTPRWALAQNDDILSVAALIEDFHCSAGL